MNGYEIINNEVYLVKYITQLSALRSLFNTSMTLCAPGHDPFAAAADDEVAVGSVITL